MKKANNVLAFPTRQAEMVPPVAVPTSIHPRSVSIVEVIGSDLIGLQIFPGDYVCYTRDFTEADFHANELFAVRTGSGFHARRIVKATSKGYDMIRGGAGAIETFKRSEVEVLGRVFSVQRRIGREA